MDIAPTLSILIVNYKTPEMTKACLDSVAHCAAGVSHEVIVADNDSRDGSLEFLAQSHPGARLLAMGHNAGFGAANNRAADLARGRYLLLLNNDATLRDDTLPRLIETLESDPAIGIVGPEIHYPDGRFQLSCGPDIGLWNELVMKHFARRLARRIQRGPALQRVDWVSGACMLIPRDLYKRVGGFDETFFLYMEDADLCRRLRRLGFCILLDRRAIVHHHLGETTSRSRDDLLPAIKRGQLHYYAVHKSRITRQILRLYLYLRFRWNRSLPAAVKKNLLTVIRRSHP
jgi:GT2 family glycosyltransferase